MVEVYADGVLIYDPNLEGTELLGLTATVNVEKGGVAEIYLPPDHPAYNSFVSCRTIVTIYRDGELVFRGRALYPSDDFYNRRKITCEGERCFLRDAVMEPYLYQASPAAIFSDVINKYNEQVDEFKRFRIGEITVTDPNDYQYIKCESASSVSDVIDKLVEYVGGFITFTTDSDGQRVINWLESLGRQSGQIIEFGENLLDFTRSDANTELATVVYPYGAKNDETGKRVNITSVNQGKLYVKDDAAVSKHGWIAKPVFWDDVTLAGNLLRKANQYLETSRLVMSTLELSAVDLSAIDRNIDSFRVGDNIRVLSAPHGVDDTFLLRERTYNFLDPSQDKVVLGKDMVTLTHTTATTEKNTTTQLLQSGQTVNNTYNVYPSDGDIVKKSNVLTVGAVGCQFTTINAAIEHAKGYCSSANRVLIRISPGTYMEEIVLNPNPGIDFEGADRNSTWVVYPSKYPNSPVYTCGEGTFKNLTLYCNGSPDENGVSAYGVHVEYQIVPNAVGNTNFINCHIQSHPGAAVGIGLGGYSTVRFQNCMCVSEAAFAVYVHGYPASNVANQNFIAERCIFRSMSGYEALRVDDINGLQGVSGSVLTIECVECRGNKVILRNGTSSYQGHIPTTGDTRLSPYSGGNEFVGANADEVDNTVDSICPRHANGTFFLPWPNAYLFDITPIGVFDNASQNIASTVRVYGKSKNGFVLTSTSTDVGPFWVTARIQPAT